MSARSGRRPRCRRREGSSLALAGALAFTAFAFAAPAFAAPAPPPAIIDMHMHAYAADAYGTGAAICAPYPEWPARDPALPMDDYLRKFTIAPDCPVKLVAPSDDAALRRAEVAVLRRRHILAVASGPADQVEALRAAAPGHVFPALEFGETTPWPTIAELRALHAAGRLQVLGEIVTQYAGIAPDDPRLEPYYALAEELDIPVGVHVGPAPPGAAYFAAPAYRARLSDPLQFEDVLLRHPKLRLYVMHAGWPFGERMIALLFAHPQVYVDVGIIDYAYRRSDFWPYLKRLVDAGFGRRIMFGSDQMVWPGAIEIAIANIADAPFLTAQQKRDILHDNAMRFLRLPN